MELGARAAERTLGRVWSWLTPISPGLGFVPARVLATAFALLAAFVAMPFFVHRGTSPAKEDGGAVKIQVVVVDGAVRLAWSDGKRDSYTVSKSSDPRSFSRQDAHIVKSNVWTDTRPGSASIVFYRVD